MASGDITVGNFKLRFPALGVDTPEKESLVEILLDEAKIEVSCCVFGAYYQRAVFLLTAHNYVLEQTGVDEAGTGQDLLTAYGAQGVINSASVADVSIGQDFSAAGDLSSGYYGNLPTTKFGQDYLRLMKKVGKGPQVARERQTQEPCAPTTPGICL